MRTNKEYDKINDRLDAALAEVEKLTLLIPDVKRAYDSGFKMGIDVLIRLVNASDACVCPPDGDDVDAMLEFGEAMDAARAAIRGEMK